MPDITSSGGGIFALIPTNIFAPCGYELFPGGQSAYENTVQKEIQGHDVLEYKARFINNYAQDASTVVIADREYNAKEIAKAAMGSFSVVDVGQATPNRFSCLLAPPEGSGVGARGFTTPGTHDGKLHG